MVNKYLLVIVIFVCSISAIAQENLPEDFIPDDCYLYFNIKDISTFVDGFSKIPLWKGNKEGLRAAYIIMNKFSANLNQFGQLLSILPKRIKGFSVGVYKSDLMQYYYVAVAEPKSSEDLDAFYELFKKLKGNTDEKGVITLESGHKIAKVNGLFVITYGKDISKKVFDVLPKGFQDKAINKLEIFKKAKAEIVDNPPMWGFANPKHLGNFFQKIDNPKITYRQFEHRISGEKVLMAFLYDHVESLSFSHRFSNEEVLFDFKVVSKNVPEVKKAFDIEATTDAMTILPVDAPLSIILKFKDCKTTFDFLISLYDRAEELYLGTKGGKLNRLQSSCKEAGVDLQKDIINNISNEVGIFMSPIYQTKRVPVYFLKCENPDKVYQAIKKIGKFFYSKSVISASPVEDIYKGVDVFYSNNPEVYFATALYDKYVFFGGHEETIKDIIDMARRNKTVGKNREYQKIFNTIGQGIYIESMDLRSFYSAKLFHPKFYNIVSDKKVAGSFTMDWTNNKFTAHYKTTLPLIHWWLLQQANKNLYFEDNDKVTLAKDKVTALLPLFETYYKAKNGNLPKSFRDLAKFSKIEGKDWATQIGISCPEITGSNDHPMFKMIGGLNIYNRQDHIVIYQDKPYHWIHGAYKHMVMRLNKKIDWLTPEELRKELEKIKDPDYKFRDGSK